MKPPGVARSARNTSAVAAPGFHRAITRQSATTIGRELGLRSGAALTGDVIEAMDDLERREAIAGSDVIARASPQHKMRLVLALQENGAQVAMTGDGVNDGPALKTADIGVAMGDRGTDAAREASDLVLTDDNFATITSAVKQGRVVFDNITKSLLFMLLNQRR